MSEEKINFNITAENAEYAMQQFAIMQQIEKNNKEKDKALMARLEKFNEIKTLEEAKELIAKIMPVANEINRFKIGNSKCTIIMKDNLVRISVDTKDELLCYNFE